MKRLLSIILAVFFCLVMLGRPLISGEAKGKDESAQRKALFEQKCSQCHASNRVNEGHRSKEELKKILERMTSKPGCNINAKEAQEIEMYLIGGDIGPAGVPGM
jgi:hypothetical protein